MSQKILEYKNKDWMAGISAQRDLPMGGLFQSLMGCDPFEFGGLACPSLAPASQSLGTTPLSLVSWNSGPSSYTNYIYALSATKLYQVLKDSPYTVVDQTSQINQNLYSGGTMVSMSNATTWKGKYIYVIVDNNSNGYVRANTFAVASGNDQTLQRGFQNNMDYMAMCEGADGNLYCGNDSCIFEQTTATGTTNGTTQTGNGVQFKIDPGFYVRDILNDGRYLVIFADNNTMNVVNRVTGSYQCKIYFWHMVQTDGNGRIVCDAIWNFIDSYIIGAKVTEGNAIQMITYNGIWVTNVATFPKMIRPFPSVAYLALQRPTNPSQIVYVKGSLLWTGGGISTSIYGYGNPITGQQKIFYAPYPTGASNLPTCLLSVGNNFIVGDASNTLYFFNVTGSARGTISLQSLCTDMIQPCRFDFIKVVLDQKLIAGQSVQVTASSNGGQDLITNETQSYASPGKQSFLFRRVPTTTNQPDKFENLTINVSSVGAPIPASKRLRDAFG
jgi:hypothetical protein